MPHNGVPHPEVREAPRLHRGSWPRAGGRGPYVVFVSGVANAESADRS